MWVKGGREVEKPFQPGFCNVTAEEGVLIGETGHRDWFWQFEKMNKKVPYRPGVPWSFTDKQFTPWGGLRIFEEMLRRLGWEQALARAALPQPGSNRGIDPVLMVQSFLVTIWTGGGRFAHTAF